MNSGRCHIALLVALMQMSLSTVGANTIDTILAQYNYSQACKADYDVVVLLDRSEEVEEERFTGFIELIKNLLTLFDIREDGNHFGLVLYNNNAEIAMKLNQNNNATFINNYLMTSLPGRKGCRNVERALRETREKLLTPATGDRPDVPNICFLLTTGYCVRNNKQFTKIKSFCKQFFVLRNGSDADMQKVYNIVGPVPSEEETKNKTIYLCNDLCTFCNNLTDSCDVEKSRSCPLPYMLVGNHCYFLTYLQKAFNESLAECVERNGSLVQVDTEEKSNELIQYIKSQGVSFLDEFLWIGLRDETGDNLDYRWVSDGSNLTYSNWLETQPDSNSQLCAGILAAFEGGGVAGYWVDYVCDRQTGAICETEQLSLTVKKETINP